MKGKMGDRALKGRPEGLEERKSKAKKKCVNCVVGCDIKHVARTSSPTTRLQEACSSRSV